MSRQERLELRQGDAILLTLEATRSFRPETQDEQLIGLVFEELGDFEGEQVWGVFVDEALHQILRHEIQEVVPSDVTL